MNSLIGSPAIIAYASAKHGLLGLTRSAAAELSAHGIRVNAVCPGIIDTPMHARLRGAARFHVAQHLGKGVNKVRAEETAELRSAGDTTLVGTRFLWLQNPENMKPKNKARFELLRDATLKVARAWTMRRSLADYGSTGREDGQSGHGGVSSAGCRALVWAR